jgi:hypothetical protein
VSGKGGLGGKGGAAGTGGASGCSASPGLDSLCAGQPHFYLCDTGAAPPSPRCVLRSNPGDANPIYCCP